MYIGGTDRLLSLSIRGLLCASLVANGRRINSVLHPRSSSSGGGGGLPPHHHIAEALSTTSLLLLIEDRMTALFTHAYG